MVRMISLGSGMLRRRRPFLSVGRALAERDDDMRKESPTTGTAGHIQIMLLAYQCIVVLMALSGLLVMKFLQEVSRQMFTLLLYACCRPPVCTWARSVCATFNSCGCSWTFIERTKELKLHRPHDLINRHWESLVWLMHINCATQRQSKQT